MQAFSKLEETTWNELFLNEVEHLFIPIYQRAYVWNHTEASDLLNNIKKSCENNDSFYYLGDIVLCKKEKSPGDLLIVDGQQRLTTLTVMVSTIRSIAIENKFQQLITMCNKFIKVENQRSQEKAMCKYKLNIPDTSEADYGNEFRWYIQSIEGIERLLNFDSNRDNSVIDEYVMRLQEIVNNFYEILDEENENILMRLVDYIGKNCLFVVKLTNQFLDAHRIFCAINIAGQQLSAIDFLRARTYGEVVKQRGYQDITRQIESKFKIFNNIKKELLKESEMNRFLLHVCRVKMIENDYKNEFLNSFSINESNMVQYFINYSDQFDSCDSLLEDIQKCFEVWKSIFIISLKTPSKDILKTINDRNWEVWITIALLSKLKGTDLNDEFWNNLEKYVCINFVLTSQKIVNEADRCSEILTQNYDFLRKIQNNDDNIFDFDEGDIDLFCDCINGNVDKTLKEECVKFI